MKLGVMQPYVFPYLGYFQYLHASDQFILYDDVQFIMRGWINRNSFLLDGAPHRFTIPLIKASPNKTIRDTMIAWDGAWEAKVLRTLELAYRHAPNRDEVVGMVHSLFEERPYSIADLARRSIEEVATRTGITTTVIPSSTVFGNAALGRVERLLDLCHRTGSKACIVPAGGRELYAGGDFEREGIELYYIAPVLSPYPQGRTEPFVPSLSILDALMWNDTAGMQRLVAQNNLERA